MTEELMLIQRNSLGRVDSEQAQAGADSAANHLMAQGLPEYAYMAAQRKIFIANAFASTAFAPAAAPPTTSPGWVLWNGNAEDSLLLLSVGIISISGTLGLGLSMVGGVTTQEQLDATMAEYASSVIKQAGGGSQGSGCRIVSNPTILGTPAYEIIAARDQVSAVSVGSGLVADLKGSILVPPRFGYALEVVAPVGTTALFTVSFKFAKVRLRLADS